MACCGGIKRKHGPLMQRCSAQCGRSNGEKEAQHRLVYESPFEPGFANAVVARGGQVGRSPRTLDRLTRGGEGGKEPVQEALTGR